MASLRTTAGLLRKMGLEHGKDFVVLDSKKHLSGYGKELMGKVREGLVGGVLFRGMQHAFTLPAAFLLAHGIGRGNPLTLALGAGGTGITYTMSRFPGPLKGDYKVKEHAGKIVLRLLSPEGRKFFNSHTEFPRQGIALFATTTIGGGKMIILSQNAATRLKDERKWAVISRVERDG